MIAEARYGALHNDVLQAFCTGQHIINQLNGVAAAYLDAKAKRSNRTWTASQYY